MRILILNWKDLKHPEVGGAEIITHELAKRLVKRGHKVIWFCRNFPGRTPQDRYDGIRVVRQGDLLTTYWKAYRFYRELDPKPDLVIDMVNTLAWQTSLYVPKNQRLAYVNQLAREVFFYQLVWPLSWLAYVLEPLQFLTYRTMPFVCYAKSTKQDLARAGIAPQRVKTFTLGLDRGRYTPGKKADFPLFITLGRLARMKRNDLVIQAMAEVIKKIPNAKLAIIGNGPHKEALKKLVKKLGLGSAVTIQDEQVWFFGKSPKDQKVALLQSAWALVIPSVKEGWGMVVTEAAACSTPAIGTKVTGLSDSITHGKTGLLVSANPTPQELANAMIKLGKNHKLRSSLAKGALAFSKTLSWEKSFDEFRRAVIQVTGIAL
ncbi:glycosyltransferase family 4 protein [Candidatus Berkelbacteria bacterium]|nr:glycosyltransferase family 4 protein [Candidatus Berkelbacteria bacterium]